MAKGIYLFNIPKIWQDLWEYIYYNFEHNLRDILISKGKIDSEQDDPTIQDFENKKKKIVQNLSNLITLQDKWLIGCFFDFDFNLPRILKPSSLSRFINYESKIFKAIEKNDSILKLCYDLRSILNEVLKPLSYGVDPDYLITLLKIINKELYIASNDLLLIPGIIEKVYESKIPFVQIVPSEEKFEDELEDEDEKDLSVFLVLGNNAFQYISDTKYNVVPLSELDETRINYNKSPLFCDLARVFLKSGVEPENLKIFFEPFSNYDSLAPDIYKNCKNQDKILIDLLHKHNCFIDYMSKNWNTLYKSKIVYLYGTNEDKEGGISIQLDDDFTLTWLSDKMNSIFKKQKIKLLFINTCTDLQLKSLELDLNFERWQPPLKFFLKHGSPDKRAFAFPVGFPDPQRGHELALKFFEKLLILNEPSGLAMSKARLEMENDLSPLLTSSMKESNSWWGYNIYGESNIITSKFTLIPRIIVHFPSESAPYLAETYPESIKLALNSYSLSVGAPPLHFGRNFLNIYHAPLNFSKNTDNIKIIGSIFKMTEKSSTLIYKTTFFQFRHIIEKIRSHGNGNFEIYYTQEGVKKYLEKKIFDEVTNLAFILMFPFKRGKDSTSLIMKYSKKRFENQIYAHEIELIFNDFENLESFKSMDFQLIRHLPKNGNLHVKINPIVFICLLRLLKKHKFMFNLEDIKKKRFTYELKIYFRYSNQEIHKNITYKHKKISKIESIFNFINDKKLYGISWCKSNYPTGDLSDLKSKHHPNNIITPTSDNRGVIVFGHVYYQILKKKYKDYLDLPRPKKCYIAEFASKKMLYMPMFLWTEYNSNPEIEYSSSEIKKYALQCIYDGINSLSKSRLSIKYSHFTDFDKFLNDPNYLSLSELLALYEKIPKQYIRKIKENKIIPLYAFIEDEFEPSKKKLEEAREEIEQILIDFRNDYAQTTSFEGIKDNLENQILTDVYIIEKDLCHPEIQDILMLINYRVIAIAKYEGYCDDCKKFFSYRPTDNSPFARYNETENIKTEKYLIHKNCSNQSMILKLKFHFPFQMYYRWLTEKVFNIWGVLENKNNQEKQEEVKKEDIFKEKNKTPYYYTDEILLDRILVFGSEPKVEKDLNSYKKKVVRQIILQKLKKFEDVNWFYPIFVCLRSTSGYSQTDTYFLLLLYIKRGEHYSEEAIFSNPLLYVIKVGVEDKSQDDIEREISKIKVMEETLDFGEYSTAAKIEEYKSIDDNFKGFLMKFKHSYEFTRDVPILEQFRKGKKIPNTLEGVYLDANPVNIHKILYNLANKIMKLYYSPQQGDPFERSTDASLKKLNIYKNLVLNKEKYKTTLLFLQKLFVLKDKKEFTEEMIDFIRVEEKGKTEDGKIIFDDKSVIGKIRNEILNAEFFYHMGHIFGDLNARNVLIMHIHEPEKLVFIDHEKTYVKGLAPIALDFGKLIVEIKKNSVVKELTEEEYICVDNYYFTWLKYYFRKNQLSIKTDIKEILITFNENQIKYLCFLLSITYVFIHVCDNNDIKDDLISREDLMNNIPLFLSNVKINKEDNRFQELLIGIKALCIDSLRHINPVQTDYLQWKSCLNTCFIAHKKNDYSMFEQMKINRKPLKSKMFNDLIKDFMSGFIINSEMIKYICLFAEYGLDVAETAFLTKAMAESGTIIQLEEFKKKIIDDPSTGGILTKTPIIISTILSCFDFCIPKLSSASLATTCGTVDILKAFGNLRTDFSINELKENLNNVGICYIEPTREICPADKRIYTLRKIIRDKLDKPEGMKAPCLLVSSILSKKYAMGCSSVIVDIKVGPGGNVDDVEDGIRLGNLFVEVGKIIGIDTVCVVSNEFQPQGKAFGMNLAVKEIIDVLKGSLHEKSDIVQLCLNIAANFLYFNNTVNSVKEGIKKIQTLIRDRTVIEKFKEIIRQQGGVDKLIENPDLIELATLTELKSTSEGYIKEINAKIIDNLTKELIIDKTDPKSPKKDYTTGIYLIKKIGDKVKTGETYARIYSNDENLIKSTLKQLREAIKISTKGPINPPKVIFKVIP